MKSVNIKFDPPTNPSRVILDLETYDEIRRSLITHGDTDLPAIPVPEPAKIFSGPKKGEIVEPKTQ